MSFKVLISGGGIAGPSLAYWLAKSGIKSTIVERAPKLRVFGQTVDVTGVGREVLLRMGLEQAVRERGTKEAGTKFIDEYDNLRATLSTGESFSPTNELEILRGDFVQILYEHTHRDTQYIFGDYIESIKELEDRSQVTFKSGKVEDYDIVVGADGLGSPTRKFVTSDKSCFKPIGQSVAFFSIPHKETDQGFSRWTLLPGSRSVWLRPNGHGKTSAYLMITKKHPELDIAMKWTVPEQKKLLREHFSDISNPKIKQVLEEMEKTDDFYLQKTAQIHLNSWSKGRVVLLGDAAYCPSPFSGSGTTASLVGAYVLAGEIAKNPKNYSQAFSAYEALLRPWIKAVQDCLNPKTFHPETRWGIKILYSILPVIVYVTQTRIGSFAMKYIPSNDDEKITLPNYKL